MSDFLNPLGGRFIGPSGPVATSAVMGTVPDPPRGFRLLDPGTIIKGVVLGRESDGLTAIATDKGTIRVASNVALPVGTQVTLEVRPTGDRLQVLILANDATRTTPTSNPASSAAGPQAAQVAGSQPNATATPAPHGQPAPLTAASPPGPDARSPDPRAADLRNAAPNAAASTTPRAEPPSIQFVGSSLRAVVVHAPPPQPQATPAPTQTQLPLPPAAQAQAPQPPQAQPQQAQPQQPPANGPQPVQAQPLPSPTPPGPALPNLPPPPAPVVQMPGQPAPVPPPVIVSPPPAPLPPVPTSTMPPIPAQPATIPLATTTLPTTPQMSLPPQGGQPLPQGIPLPNAPIPAPIPNLATMQATLLAAAAEKKDKVSHLGTLPAGAVTQRAGAAMVPSFPQTQTPAQATGDAAPEAMLSGSTLQIPAGAALSADNRLRILALFASAAATAEHSQHAATDEVQSALVPITAKHPAQPLPLGAELKLRVLAVQMQAHQQIEVDPIALDPEGHGQVIFGRVVAITPAGHAVIHTPIGDIMLQDRSSLPQGAKLALAIDTLETAPPPAAIAAPVVQNPQQALLSLAQGWPTLAELIAIFRSAAAHPGRAGEIDPEIARQALAALPHAGSKLGAGMMSAMAALRAGDLGKLLGPLFAAKGTGSDREEMVRRLKGEFTQLSALAQERPEVDWRALFLPVIDDQGRVTQINLFYRHPKKGETEDRPGGGTGTRFVVEADFSRLGPFQLDGLMRQQRFDLMIRSRARLTDRMRREIEAIYEEARGLTGFAGSIAFQTVDEFPVIPLDDLKRGTPTVMV